MAFTRLNVLLGPLFTFLNTPLIVVPEISFDVILSVITK